MSDMAKQARAAMKAKASRLTTADPHQKVDSSTWTPPEPLNTEVKTGLRPISRRAFKSGGSVQGGKAKTNLGKGTRTGNKPITPNNFANKDVKAANEDRMGLKHVGGMKSGGRLKRQAGGPNARNTILDSRTKQPDLENMPITPEMERRMRGIMDESARKSREYEAGERAKEDYKVTGQKRGGKVKKAMGGAMAGARRLLEQGQERAGVPASTLGFTGVKKGALSPARAVGVMKKGGAVHDDVKADMALIKKMVKPAAMRKGRATGGNVNEPEKEAPGLLKLKSGAPTTVQGGTYTGSEKERTFDSTKLKRKSGGGVFSGPGYPGKVPGVTGGRIARATGGKTRGKGKTNINIVIAAGKPAGQQDMMGPPPGMDMGLPPGVPVPVPPAGGAPGGGAPMAMPVPMPMPMAGGAPAGGAPMPTPRKSGGRLTAKASSYKDMTAGAGSGEGRLQKTDIAKDRMGRKAGGKAYRSYKDMDAGAGSGMGRLEKTEIQAHKR